MHPQSTTEPAISSSAAPPIGDELRAAIMAEIRGPERVAPPAADACVLAYERVSKSVQVSIPDQRRAIEEDVQRHGAHVARHRWDVGSRWDNERPDYRALHRDIESGQYTHLWLFNADRLGGDDLEFVATVRKAIKHGMVVRDTIHGEISDDMASILGLQSYWEIKNNHYRVVLKLHGKHLEGVKLGAVPPGYAPQCTLHPCRCGLHGKHKPAEPLASVVRELFGRCRAGESIEALRRYWNAETGQRRDHGGILHILRNPYYAGIIVNCRWRHGRVQGRGKRKQEDWKVGSHDYPLVDAETFAVVQARLRTQENVGQHRSGGASHPLVGLLHCAGCERRLQRTRQYGGGQSYRYECPLCKHGRSERKIERALHAKLAEIPFPVEDAVADYARQHERMERAVRREIAELEAECDRINRRRSVWADDRGDGTMSKEDYRTKIAESDKQLEELRQQRAALEQSDAGQPGRAALLSEVRDALRRLGDWTQTIPRMTAEERRGMYRCMLRAIRLDMEAGLMTVEYTDALRGWCGRSGDVAPLPSQK